MEYQWIFKSGEEQTAARLFEILAKKLPKQTQGGGDEQDCGVLQGVN